MTLYESLAPVYDALFQVDERAHGFLDALAPGPRGDGGPAVLDAGCATGAHALALAALGWKAVGVDSEASMVALARAKAESLGLSARASFLELDILDVKKEFPSGSFDLALCLGNTLPHLVGEGAAADFLSQARSILAPGGALVLQTLNFSLPKVGPGYAFPKLAGAGALMRRSYAAPPPDHPGALRFVVELDSAGAISRSETLLLRLGPSRIGEMLKAAGFATSLRYSGWAGAAFDEAADPYCITVARA